MRRNADYFLGAGLVVLTLAVHGRTVGFQFVGLDDQVYVTQNPHVLGGLNPASIAWAFTTMSGSNWHPLTWLSLMLDSQIAGPAPAVYHATNVLLHIVNALLLFYVLRRMTRAPGRSAFVAALFAIHPLHVESVAWVAERKDVLSTMFWFLTLLAYTRYVERPGAGRYAVVAAVYLCGLLSKPMLVTLPVVLLLLDFWPLGRLGAEGSGALALAVEKALLLALSAASCGMTLIAQSRGGAMAPLEMFPLWARAGNASLSYLAYLRDTFWPSGLAILYLHPGDRLPIWQALVSGAIVLALTGLALALARRKPYVTVGWLWYVLTLVPVIGLVQVGVQGRADRYTYVPLTGIFILVAWGGVDLANAWARSPGARRLRAPDSPGVRGALGAAAAAGVAVVVVLAAFSYVQAGHWSDRMTLLLHVNRVLPGNYLVCNALGTAYEARGEFDEALVKYREAVQILPTRAPSRSNLGVALLRRGRVDEAIVELSEAVRLDPKSAEAQNNLGSALSKSGRLDEAIIHHREAIRLAPPLLVPHVDLADLLMRRGAAPEAAAQYGEALVIDPESADAHAGFGAALSAQGRLEEAVAHCREAIRLTPKHARANTVLGTVLLARGAVDEALVHLSAAVEADPAYAEARANLAGALLRKGRVEDAIAQCREALRLSPDLPGGHANLGIALSRKGELGEAAAHLEKAVAARPDEAILHGSLGIVRMREGRLEEAAREFGEAVRLDPGLTDARLNLGAVLANLGQEEAAAAQFEEVLRREPGEGRARRNLEILRSAGHGHR